MTVYVSQLILHSQRLIGEKERGDTLDATEAAELLMELNSMLESWSVDRINCYTISEVTTALTASTATYSIGPNATISTARPIKLIDPCFVRDGSGYDTPLQILDSVSYGQIVDKDSGYVVPIYIYYDAGFNSSGQANIKLYPSPSSSLTLHLTAWLQLSNLSSVSQALNFPPGYQRAITYNFAIESAPGFASITPEIAKVARESLANIQSINLPAPISLTEVAGVLGGVYGGHGGRRNILTG